MNRRGGRWDIGGYRLVRRASPGRIGRCVAVCVATSLFIVVACLALHPASASADVSFCQFGSSAGKCNNPQGVAVDFETGRVYVADRANNRVNVFESNGSFVFAFGWGVADGTTNALQTCTITCFKGIAGTGAGQFSGLAGIAVDNAPGSPSRHDIYVVNSSSSRIQKFAPTGSFLLGFGSPGTGPGQFDSIRGIAVTQGVVYVVDTTNLGACSAPGVGVPEFKKRLQKFEEAGILVEAVELPDVPCGQVRGFAAAANGDFYLFHEEGPIRKYGPGGAVLYSQAEKIESTALTVDAADNLFAAQREDRANVADSFRVITGYDPAGAYIRRFGYGALSFPSPGLAAYSSASGDLLATEPNVGSETVGNRVAYLAIPAPGPVPAPPSLEATSVGSTKATLAVELNPEGKATEYHFDYVDQQGFEEAGFSGPKTRSTPTAPLAATDFKLHYVTSNVGCPDPVAEADEGKCLTPGTAYHFRVVATNADGQGESQATFETKPPLEILATWATEVGTDSARLSAEVNPLGIPTSGYFEYVDDVAYQATGFATASKVPDAGKGQGVLDFGSGEVGATRSALLSGLLPGTTYHYRAVAVDPLIEPVAGPATVIRTFATPVSEPCTANAAFRTGASAWLPDCRAYEMVSPLDKENGDIIALAEATTDLPASLDQSATDGSKLSYGSYRAFGGVSSAPFTSQYLAERDQTSGWLSHSISPPRERLKLSPVATLDTELKLLSPDLCEAWSRTVAESPLAPNAVADYTNLYRRQDDNCGGASYEALTTVAPPNVNGEHYKPLELQGTTADGGQAIYVADDSLPGSGAPAQPAECVSEEKGCLLQLYLQQTGEGLPQFVCILPSGVPFAGGCSGGSGGEDSGQMRRGNVGNAISSDGTHIFWTAAGVGPGKIYLRLNPSQPQSALAGEECTEAPKACTVAVSKAAEVLSGTSSSQFWAAADNGSAALFTSGQDLYEFRTESKATVLIAKKVLGLLGASEDASHVYFASEEVLTGANPQGQAPAAGKANVYHHEAGGGFDFVATLAPGDANLTPLKGRTSPISLRPLSRTSRITPDGLHASFMSVARLTGYDNVDAKSGEADAEVYLFDATANGGDGALVCASCNPSGARPVGADIGAEIGNSFWAAAQIPVWQNNLYAARVLSEDGNRLYFESTDALTPLDSNGVQDVYQWEAAGKGGCDAADPSFSSTNQGCVDLISSGQSAGDSEISDVSPSGDDVFFATLASLVTQDYGLVDIYDARIGGGFPSPPPAAPECEGESCQTPAPAPPFAPPSSLEYQGPTNVSEPKVKKKCRKGKVRKGNRCVKKKSRGKSKTRSGRR